MTWVSRSSRPPTLCASIILAASPSLATLFIRTQITASSFQLSIFLLWSERNAYRCLSHGELQASTAEGGGASFLLLILFATAEARGSTGKTVLEEHIQKPLY